MSKDIVAIGVQPPGHKYHDLTENLSLQDYDLILFKPVTPFYGRHSFSSGESSVDTYNSKRFREHMAHWKSELSNAVNDGKTVFLLLPPKTSFLVMTGRVESKAKVTTYGTSTYDNYSFLPFAFQSITSANGQKMKYLGHPAFTTFWTELEDDLSYQCYFDEPYGTPIFTTKGDRTVGAVKQIGKGFLVILPMIDFERDDFTEVKDGEDMWTKKALQFGKRLDQYMVEIDKALRSELASTPSPSWAKKVQISERQAEIELQISKIDTDIDKLLMDKEQRQEDLTSVSGLNGLLYEKGKPLEKAIIDALRLFGYAAEGYDDGSIELDQVITSPEGERYVGEAEGKDKHAVNIDKFRQLNTNLDEDFERDEVSERATGILFGNGFRLTEPSKREPQFTEKCLTNALRTSTILVQTADMYEPARYLMDNPDDETYKKKCRAAIKKSLGQIVNFPKPSKKSSMAEQTVSAEV
jgi:hypothetical protein